MSTSAVDTWRAIKIWTKNVTDVANEFLLLTQVLLMKQMKTQVLNLKKSKTQIPIKYLTQKIIIKKDKLSRATAAPCSPGGVPA
jgi:hypothetical protein